LIAAALIVIAVVAYVGYYFLSTGEVTVYVQDDPSPLKVYLTVDSIMLHRVNGSWITVSNSTITFELSSNITHLISARIPVGKYNEIFLHISNVTLSISGLGVILPSHVLKVHFVGDDDLIVSPAGSSQVVIDFPHISVSPQGVIISPSVTAQATPAGK
jgi:hypothetical protein